MKGARYATYRQTIQEWPKPGSALAGRIPIRPVVRQNFSRGPNRGGSGRAGVNTTIDSAQQEDPKRAGTMRVERTYIKDRPKVGLNYAARL